MSAEEYRNALENMHKLVDELEDVTIENQVLAQENIELEKDVQFISEKHNETVEGIKKLAYNTRNYRINRTNNNQNNCPFVQNNVQPQEVKYVQVQQPQEVKYVQVQQPQEVQVQPQEVKHHKHCHCENCNHPISIADNDGMMNKLFGKLGVLKNKLIFIVALLLVIMLAIGASPSNAISWKAFTDLYIEFICNPATMAMAVALVVLLYKGIVKKKNK